MTATSVGLQKKLCFTKKDDLKEFEKKVNECAVQLALNDTGLLKKRGDLLALARQNKASEKT